MYFFFALLFSVNLDSFIAQSLVEQLQLHGLMPWLSQSSLAWSQTSSDDGQCENMTFDQLDQED